MIEADARHFEVPELLEILHKLKLDKTYRTLLSKFPDNILVLARDYRIEFINWTLDGIDPATVRGKSVFDFIPEGDHARIRGSFDSVFRTGIPSDYAVSTDAGGSVTSWKTRVFPIFSGSAVDKLLLIAAEVTVQIEIEKQKHELLEQLRQSQKMEALGTLAGGIAHDFNNILGSLTGFLHLMKKDIAKGKDPGESISEIDLAILRAKDLVGQILLYARKGKSKYEMRELQPIVDGAVKFMRRSIPQSVDIDVHLDAPGKVARVDANQIHQVVVNLCANAYQALEGKKGNIAISLKTVNVMSKNTGTFKHTGPHLCLSVEDSGVGISPENIGKVFDPFFTTKETGEGTGLGLSIVSGIVAAHEGNVVVRSKEGRGAKFEAFFPEFREE